MKRGRKSELMSVEHLAREGESVARSRNARGFPSSRIQDIPPQRPAPVMKYSNTISAIYIRGVPLQRDQHSRQMQCARPRISRGIWINSTSLVVTCAAATSRSRARARETPCCGFLRGSRFGKINHRFHRDGNCSASRSAGSFFTRVNRSLLVSGIWRPLSRLGGARSYVLISSLLSWDAIY